MAEPFLGQITLFAGTFNPSGWALCNGQLLSISQNSALFSILGTTYGGDGQVTFALPDLRGRVSVHPGSGAGLQSISLGQKGGANNHTLTTQQLPSHTHNLRGSTNAADASDPTGAVPAVAEDADRNPLNVYDSGTANASMDATAIQNTGSGQQFSLMPPFLGVHYIIALQGTFPSQN